MKRPKGWRNEPARHSLAAHGISTGSRGIVKKAKIHAYNLSRTFHPKNLEAVYIHRDLNIYSHDKAYEALDQNNWDREMAYDYLNAELELLRQEYEQTGDENTKLQMDVVKQAKLEMDDQDSVNWLRNEWPEKREKRIEKYYGDQMQSSGRPIILGISGRGSFDGDLQISLEGAEELMPLLRSRGVAMQALNAFNSSSGTQKIKGNIGDIKANLTVTHPGEDVLYVRGDLGYKVDRAFTKDELKELYGRLKALI